jgi:hypothetical protein
MSDIVLTYRGAKPDEVGDPEAWDAWCYAWLFAGSSRRAKAALAADDGDGSCYFPVIQDALERVMPACERAGVRLSLKDGRAVIRMRRKGSQP